jgi:hypothetical protein
MDGLYTGGGMESGKLVVVVVLAVAAVVGAVRL